MAWELIATTLGGAAAATGIGKTLQNRVASEGQAYTTEGEMRRKYAIDLSTIIYNMGSNYHQYNLGVANFDWDGLTKCLEGQDALLDSDIPTDNIRNIVNFSRDSEWSRNVDSLKETFNGAIRERDQQLETEGKNKDQRFSVEEIDDAKAEKAAEFFRGNYFRHISDIIIDKVDFSDWLTRQADSGVIIPERFLKHDAIVVTEWDRMFSNTVKQFRADLGMSSDSPMAITNNIEGYCAADIAYGLLNGNPKTYEGKYEVGRVMHGNNAFDKIDVARFVTNANKTAKIRNDFRKAFGITGDITEESLRKSEKFLKGMSDTTIRQGTDVQGGIARLLGGMTTENFLDAFQGDGVAGVQGKNLFIDFFENFKDGINKSILAFEKDGKIPIPNEKIIINGMSHPGGYWNIKDFMASEEGSALAKLYTGREFDYKYDKSSFTQSDAILLQQVILTDVLERSGMARRFSKDGATTVNSAIQTAKVAIALGVPVSKEFSEMPATSVRQISVIPKAEHPKTHISFGDPHTKKFNAGVVAFLENAPGDPYDLDVALDQMAFVSGPRRINRPIGTKISAPVEPPSIMRVQPGTKPENIPAGATQEWDPAVLHIQLTYKYSNDNTEQRKQVSSILKAPFAWLEGSFENSKLGQKILNSKGGKNTLRVLGILGKVALAGSTALYSPIVAIGALATIGVDEYLKRKHGVGLGCAGWLTAAVGLPLSNEGVKALQDPLAVINEGDKGFQHVQQLSIDEAKRYSFRNEATSAGANHYTMNDPLMVVSGNDTSFVVVNDNFAHWLTGNGVNLTDLIPLKNPKGFDVDPGQGVSYEYHKVGGEKGEVVVHEVVLPAGTSINLVDKSEVEENKPRPVTMHLSHEGSDVGSTPSTPTPPVNSSKSNKVTVDDAFYVYKDGGNDKIVVDLLGNKLTPLGSINKGDSLTVDAGTSIIIGTVCLTAKEGAGFKISFPDGAKSLNASDRNSTPVVPDVRFQINGKIYTTAKLKQDYEISAVEPSQHQIITTESGLTFLGHGDTLHYIGFPKSDMMQYNVNRARSNSIQVS